MVPKHLHWERIVRDGCYLGLPTCKSARPWDDPGEPEQHWHRPLSFLFVPILPVPLLSPGEEALNEYLKIKTVTLEY
jgi:hypothetical protein